MAQKIQTKQRQEVPVLETDPRQGLTTEQAALRSRCGWDNRTTDGTLRTEKQIILQNILTFFNLVFVVLAVVLAISGSSVKNMTFLVVVAINVVIGCFQEIRAKRAVEKLTLVAARPVRTVRNGALVEIPSVELVRDDIVLFAPGDQICADAVVCDGDLQVNESLITGEADAISKPVGAELRSGSFVVAGKAYARLTKVGDDSFAARLSKEAKADPRAVKSEMMRSLDKLIRVVGIALVPIGIILFCQEFFKLQQGLTASAEATVAALVGMIPEGLYLLTSIAMAASAVKLTKQRVLVQDMNCIETLARVDVLCVDKTGTITEPRMEMDNIIALTDDPPEYLEAILTALYGGTEPDNDTARAVAEMFPGESGWVCRERIPFTSQKKYGGAVFEEQGMFLAGAPENILGSRYEDLKDRIDPWSSTGYRVLLLARCSQLPDAAGTGAEPLALLLLTNRIRPEAPETFRYFARQGVAIKVISGDNPATVSDVARRAGIENAESYVDARTLETEEDIRAAAETYTVFGRVTPDQKRSLVRALRAAGHTVAMTGDGVNDVLAMREANCGIAMASGAQAASQVAQLVLLDSDFSAMPGIVGEGRRVINNIQRAATLFLVKNIFSLFLSIITLFTSLPYPMVPLHMSVISALTIGVPSFFLAMEPNYDRFSGNFLRSVLRRAFPGGLTNIFVVLMAQIFMVVFEIPQAEISTICAAILSVVGLLVLFQVCKPFAFFRRLVWFAMAVSLVVCFTFLGTFFEMRMGGDSMKLVMLTLLIMTPTVFFATERMFDWGEMLYNRIRFGKKPKETETPQ